MAENTKTTVPEERWDELEVPVPSRAPVGKLQACVELVKRLIAELPKPVRKKRKNASKEPTHASVGGFGAYASLQHMPRKKRLVRQKRYPARLYKPEFPFICDEAAPRDDKMKLRVCRPSAEFDKDSAAFASAFASLLKPSPPDLHAPVLSFAARLLTYVNEKCDGVAPMAYKPVGISRQIYSRIVSRDDSTVNKRTAMLFCIGLKLDMKESELLLKSAGYAFSGTLPEDRIITWCIENRIWNIEDINEIFRQCSLRPIKPGKDAVK